MMQVIVLDNKRNCVGIYTTNEPLLKHLHILFDNVSIECWDTYDHSFYIWGGTQPEDIYIVLS